MCNEHRGQKYRKSLAPGRYTNRLSHSAVRFDRRRQGTQHHPVTVNQQHETKLILLNSNTFPCEFTDRDHFRGHPPPCPGCSCGTGQTQDQIRVDSGTFADQGPAGVRDECRGCLDKYLMDAREFFTKGYREARGRKNCGGESHSQGQIRSRRCGLLDGLRHLLRNCFPMDLLQRALRQNP